MKIRTANLEFADREDLGANNQIDEVSIPASKRTAIVLEAMRMFSHGDEKSRCRVLFFRCLHNEFSRPALMSQDPDAWDLVRVLSYLMLKPDQQTVRFKVA